MEHWSKIKKLNHLDHIRWQRKCKSLTFRGQIQDVVVPKETWKILKHNFRKYKHSWGLWTKIKMFPLLVSTQTLCNKWLRVAARFWTLSSIWYQCKSMTFPKRKTTDRFIMYVAINFLKSWCEHFLNRFFAIWRACLPWLCADYRKKKVRVGHI